MVNVFKQALVRLIKQAYVIRSGFAAGYDKALICFHEDQQIAGILIRYRNLCKNKDVQIVLRDGVRLRFTFDTNINVQ